MKARSENSGLVDLDALIRTMKEDDERIRRRYVALEAERRLPPVSVVVPLQPPPPRRRHQVVMAAVVLSVSGNAFAIARVASSKLSERPEPDTSAGDAADETAGAQPSVSPRPTVWMTPKATLVHQQEARQKVIMDETPPRAALRSLPASRAGAVLLPPAPAEPIAALEPVPALEAPKLNLEDAMRIAAGAPTVAPRASSSAGAPATSETSSVSQVRPAPGAIVAALAPVQDAARRCLGPDDEARACVVTFGHAGRAVRIEVPGDDAKGACIRGALSKAEVSPFAEDTYRTRITIRP